MNKTCTCGWVSILSVLLGVLISTSVVGQEDCDGYRYRYTGSFDAFDVDYSVIYGENVVNGTLVELDMDVYTPAEDSWGNRPLIVIAHGGFFLSGSNDNLDVVPLCEDLASMGYVVASMSYRLLPVDLALEAALSGTLTTEFVKAVWRGVHDSRAAVRFFRRSVAEFDNPYGIDVNRIYLGGISAGAFIAVHHAYVDDPSEIPADIDVTEEGMGGGLEGLSGNEGYSSDVNGVFNLAGALQTTDFLLTGENEPLFSVHGTEDGTVPYGEGIISLDIAGFGVDLIDVDGSSIVHASADELGMDHCLVTVEGAGHVPHLYNNADYDLTLSALAGKLGEWACEDYVPICGGYDYNAETGVEHHTHALLAHAPVVYPNPASATGHVQVLFPQSGDWQLMTAMGQILHHGFALAGSTLTWEGLNSGWYVLKTERGHTAFVVSR